MKIWIKSDATRFFVLLPTRLFLNSFLATIAIKIIKSKYPSIDISTQDFKKLIDMLGEVFDKQKDEIDEDKMSEQIVVLRKRLNTLLQSKAL